MKDPAGQVLGFTWGDQIRNLAMEPLAVDWRYNMGFRCLEAQPIKLEVA